MAARNCTKTKTRKLKDQYALLYARQLSKREILDIKDRVQKELASTVYYPMAAVAHKISSINNPVVQLLQS